MAIKEIHRTNVGDEVLEQIKSNIISGEWAPGTKIPGEIELCKLFNISRISVRQAIHRLIGMGVLTIKRGDGTYVTEMVPDRYFSSLLPILMVEHEDLLEIQEFRGMLEVESARIAAMKADEQDIARMQEAIEEMKATKGDYIKFSKADLNFHSMLTISTKNSILIKVTSIIQDIMDKAMEQAVRAVGFDAGVYYHQRILDAIAKRDDIVASAVMREHILNVVNTIKNQIT